MNCKSTAKLLETQYKEKTCLSMKKFSAFYLRFKGAQKG